jgi:putative flippase GtrA
MRPAAVKSLAQTLARSRFLRFGTVGAGGFVVDETVLWIAHRLAGLDPYSGRIISILCAMTFTWWGNRNLTFREHAAVGPAAAMREWLRFVAANAVGALVNYATYTLLVRFAPAPFANPFLATACGVAIAMVFNFTLSKHLVFRPARS